MHQIRVVGSNIIFPCSRASDEEFEIDFKDELLWTQLLDNDILIAYRADGNHILQRRLANASIYWIVTYPPSNRISVSARCTTLNVNDVVITLPGILHAAAVFSDGILVVVYPNEASGTRNLYKYRLDGTLMWQVAPRQFQASVPYHSFARLSDKVVKGYGFLSEGDRRVEDMGALIDYTNGRVIGQEDPRS